MYGLYTFALVLYFATPGDVAFVAEQRGFQILAGVGLLVIGLVALHAVGDRLARRFRADQIADRHLDLADPSVDGCAHFGVAEIELGGLQRRFGGLHIGDGFAIGVIALVVVTPGHDVITDKLRAAFELAAVNTTRALAASSWAWALSTSAA